MIVPMTRYSVLVYHRDFAAFMERLQQMGLLDIRQEEVYSEKSDEEFYPQVQRIEKVLAEFKREAKERKKQGRVVDSTREKSGGTDAKKLLHECETVLESKRNNLAELKEIEALLQEAGIWRSFNKEELSHLEKEAGLRFVFAETALKNVQDTEKLQAEFPVEVINCVAGKAYIVWVGEASEVFTSESLSKRMGFTVTIRTAPEQPLDVLQTEYARLQQEYQKIDGRIMELLPEAEVLKQEKNRLLNSLSYKTVSLNVPQQAEGSLRFVEGYLPTEQTAAFEEFLEREEVVYQSVQADKLPDEETPHIPVLLRNNRFAKLFEPITRLFSLPNYRELDLTPMLAPFFMAFFGFCLGDAGYGLLLMAAALFIVKKFPAAKSYGWLCFWFGLATVIFGTLSGTFFGISLVNIEALGNLRSYIFDSNKMMTLSLVIGAVQILFGMLMNVFRLTKVKGFKYALHRIGWLAVIVCGGLLVGAPMLGLSLPVYVVYGLEGLVIAGAILALFYNNPDKNPLFNLGLGLWDTYNTATGLVGDLLSYIRLFALGLTGGILGSVFNTLALDAANGVGVPVVSQLIMLFILLFGHSLNLALCVLGSVVHPLRLTFVEFYKNAGFAGGGKEYAPFRINK
ncbi:MAG: hypothetical protein J1F29_06255 [Lentimicrobiaceae bacterium]|nr:hypothetical protein [Lentimicrobiaceae bacterium]